MPREEAVRCHLPAPLAIEADVIDVFYIF